MVEQIFENVFGRLGWGNPMSTEDIQKNKKISGVSNPLLAFAKMLSERLSKDKSATKVVDSNNLKKINKQLRKNGFVEVKPMSKRFTDDKVRAKNKKLFLDEYDGKNTVDIGSTAISTPIKYNEETGEVWIQFKGKDGKPGGKWYHYTNMDKDQFRSFMRASSKGRYVTKVMKYKNHDPAFGPTPRKK